MCGVFFRDMNGKKSIGKKELFCFLFISSIYHIRGLVRFKTIPYGFIEKKVFVIYIWKKVMPFWYVFLINFDKKKFSSKWLILFSMILVAFVGIFVLNRIDDFQPVNIR